MALFSSGKPTDTIYPFLVYYLFEKYNLLVFPLTHFFMAGRKRISYIGTICANDYVHYPESFEWAVLNVMNK